jgi:hypothetical protein
LVASPISGLSLNALETVEGETLSFLAISFIVTCSDDIKKVFFVQRYAGKLQVPNIYANVSVIAAIPNVFIFLRAGAHHITNPQIISHIHN